MNRAYKILLASYIVLLLSYSLVSWRLIETKRELKHLRQCATVQGDVNCDGLVDVRDLSIVSDRWGKK